MVDRIAKRRGKWAHEVLELSPEHLTMEFMCLDFAAREANQTIGRLQQKSGILPVPVPVVLVGG